MKKVAMLAVAAALALVATPSLAAADWYAGAAYSQYELEDADVGGVTGRLGYRFGPNFAVEGEGTLGVEDDDNAELNSALGLYGVGVVPIGESGFSVHGRAGYQQFDVERDIGPDIDDGGFSYGAGLGWDMGGGIGLRADLTRTEIDDEDIDAISLGARVNF